MMGVARVVKEDKYFLQLRHQIKAHFLLIHIQSHYTSQHWVFRRVTWAAYPAEILAFCGLMNNGEIMCGPFCLSAQSLTLSSPSIAIWVLWKTFHWTKELQRRRSYIIHVIKVIVFKSFKQAHRQYGFTMPTNKHYMQIWQ